jgi:phosphoribosylanthranilate isomerase
MIVKICGIKTFEEALAAVDSGADMLGFNFYPPSPRCVTLEACAGILTRLAAHRRSSFVAVGVFVNHSPQLVQAVLEFCGLDLAQLSGDEPAGDLALLKGRAFKAVRPRSPQEADDGLLKFARPIAPALLVDAPAGGAYGGTGVVGDWALARCMSEKAPLLLAGGLNPENVSQAIRRVRPWGVDVASGVESSPGVKDASRMATFISVAKSNRG